MLKSRQKPSCTMLYPVGEGTATLTPRPIPCAKQEENAHILCKITSGIADDSAAENAQKVIFPEISNATLDHVSHVLCPDGHVTHAFLACDVTARCWSSGVTSSCLAPVTPLPPLFACANGVQHVAYNLVCDRLSQCDDQSDEAFCLYKECDVDKPFFCTNGQVRSLWLNW